MYSSFMRSIQASPSRGPAFVFSSGSFCTVALVASSGPDLEFHARAEGQNTCEPSIELRKQPMDGTSVATRQVASHDVFSSLTRLSLLVDGALRFAISPKEATVEGPNQKVGWALCPVR